MKTWNKLLVSAPLAAVLLAGCSTPAPTTPVTTPSPSESVSAPAAPKETKKPEADKPSEPEKPAEDKPKESKKATPEAGTALDMLMKLEVSDAHESGYDRELFGSSWADVDNNGCDTRNDILANQMADATRPDGCKVIAGTMVDPYTLQATAFATDGSGGGVDIDHVVALSAGWKTGAYNWDDSKRLSFANDPLNLLAVDAGLNRYKGDKDASEWLPSYGKSKSTAGINKQTDCPYVARQIAVKAKYGAFVTPSEKNAMEQVLNVCPGEKLPTGGIDPSTVKADPSSPVKKSEPKPEPVQEAPKSSGGGTDPDMGSCAKAKKAGYGPYQKGQAEYDFYRDGDGDGTVCE